MLLERVRVKLALVKRLLSFIGILALVALGAGLGIAYMLLRLEPLVLHQDAVVAEVSRTAYTTTYVDEAGGYLDIRPADREAETLFIFYPGGLVRPQAYEWLGAALAPLGGRTLIPVMPLDLAVIAPDRASKLLDSLETAPSRVVIGGHSLGGAMAARYALRNPERIDGLVLMGAYSAGEDDLSGLTLPVLDLAAEHDGLATVEKVQDGLNRLPPDTQLEIIDGSVHAFFGRYGPQRGDGLPTVTRAQAEAQISEDLRAFFAALP